MPTCFIARWPCQRAPTRWSRFESVEMLRQAQSPKLDVLQAKRGLVEFAAEDDRETGGEAAQLPKKRKPAAPKQASHSKQQRKAQLQNLDRFD